MTRRLALACLLLLACGSQPGAAAPASCTVSATSINFGNYSGSVVTMDGTITVKCTKGDAYDVALNAGTTTGATVSNRSMTNLGVNLSYGLYSNASYTSNWGNSTATGWVTGVGTGADQTLTVYGQIAANQYVTPETSAYSDTITVTVSGPDFTTKTTTFPVEAMVVASCTISAAPLAFGTYSGAVNNSTSTISVTCTKSTAFNVGLNAGTASGATVTNRSMTGPDSALLDYSLYSNSGHSANWGNTIGSNTVAGTGSGALQSLPVYGQIPAGQYPVPGNYSDTITATITY
jgi:spore coat protein U-like protein